MLYIKESNKKNSDAIIKKNTDKARECYKKIKQNSRIKLKLERYKNKMFADLFEEL